MLKVKLIHHTWITSKNGANTVINYLLDSKDRFAEAGIELTSFTPESLCNEVYKSPKVSVKAWVRFKIKRILTRMARYFSIAAKLVVIASEIMPAKKIISSYITKYGDSDDILFFHSLEPCYEYLRLYPKKKKIILVLHTNGDTFKMLRIYYKKLNRSKFYSQLEQFENYVLHNVDRICFVAEAARENFLRLHPDINPHIVYTIHNGVSITETKNKSFLNNPLEICCVASISDRKGQKHILEALMMFSENNIPNVHFTFIGDGSEKEHLERIVSHHHLLTERVTFAGISNEVDKYLKNSDLFILPSEDEGLPMAILEAMRASLPIISTPVGGIPELVIPDYNGVLIEPNTVGVYNILKDIQNYNWLEMGRNSRLRFEAHYTITAMVDKYIEVINAMAEK